MNTILFTVLGTPAPQGSMRRIGKFLKCDNAKTMPYRLEVGWAAARARGNGDIPFGRHVPVKAHYVFVMPPPQKMPKGRTRPSVKPDVDKLCRAVNDALTGILWHDDGQVVQMTATKEYGLPAKTIISVEGL